jgi:hypothetical protein
MERIMGVELVDNSNNKMVFHTSIWGWKYYLGLFEQGGMPGNILNEINNPKSPCPVVSQGIARSLAENIGQVVMKCLDGITTKDKHPMRLLPTSTALSATFADGFVGFLQSKKGYPAKSMTAPVGLPTYDDIKAFISFLSQTNGFTIM